MAVVLVVDDEELVRTVLRQFLEKCKFSVLEARDGEEALALIKSQRVDIVICDLIMPRLDGIATIMSIRRVAPAMKIIAISGGGRSQALELLKVAGHMGADHVLGKPFTKDQILGLVARCLTESVGKDAVAT
ncbi:response regulator [Azospirillum halopraeferens]|uniref:response regulator n=1 Tax=Azospirillum halopraeferens TaxID=34010 RepID=UPI000A05BF8E|nr:response regulator [Azospirillum halopraeferens]